MVLPGRVISQAQAGSCSDSPGLGGGGVLPATHKNKQTDHFAKIIHVGWTHWWHWSQCLRLAGTQDRVLPVRSRGFCFHACFLFSKWRGLSSVTSSPEVQQFSTNRQSLPPPSSLRQLTVLFDRSLQSHLEFSEFYQLEASRPPYPETFTGPARVVASLLTSQNPFGGKSRVVVLTVCQRDFLWVCRQLWRSS